MSKRPIIGITPSYIYEEERAVIKDGYYNGVIEAGGAPVILPVPANKECIEAYVDSLDGFIISGGPDIDAALYGEENLKFNGTLCPYRDSFEIELVKVAVSKDKPVFGICRGYQVLNVALGGTLYQDIFEQFKETRIRHFQDAPKWYGTHTVNIQKDTTLFEIFGEEQICVNSYHHQAVKDLPKDFRATIYSPDGLIEGIEHISKKHIFGVQWHPEQMWARNPQFLKLFKYFVDKCK